MKSNPKEYMIGNNLRTFRDQAGFTQAELSKLASCNVAHIENGMRLPSLETIIRLCNVLNVSADHLIFGITERHIYYNKRSIALDKIIRILKEDLLQNQ